MHRDAGLIIINMLLCDCCRCWESVSFVESLSTSPSSWWPFWSRSTGTASRDSNSEPDLIRSVEFYGENKIGLQPVSRSYVPVFHMQQAWSRSKLCWAAGNTKNQQSEFNLNYWCKTVKNPAVVAWIVRASTSQISGVLRSRDRWIESRGRRFFKVVFEQLLLLYLLSFVVHGLSAVCWKATDHTPWWITS